MEGIGPYVMKGLADGLTERDLARQKRQIRGLAGENDQLRQYIGQLESENANLRQRLENLEGEKQRLTTELRFSDYLSRELKKLEERDKKFFGPHVKFNVMLGQGLIETLAEEAAHEMGFPTWYSLRWAEEPPTRESRRACVDFNLRLWGISVCLRFAYRGVFPEIIGKPDTWPTLWEKGKEVGQYLWRALVDGGHLRPVFPKDPQIVHNNTPFLTPVADVMRQTMIRYYEGGGKSNPEMDDMLNSAEVALRLEQAARWGMILIMRRDIYFSPNDRLMPAERCFVYAE